MGDTVVRYPQDPVSGRVGLELLPAACVAQVVPRRASLRGLAYIDVMPGNDPWPASVVDSLVQFKLVGDEYPGAFAQGHTLRQSPGIDAFKLADHRVERESASTTIVTVLARDDDCRVEHRLTSREGEGAFTFESRYVNGSSAPVTLEMLSSF